MTHLRNSTRKIGRSARHFLANLSYTVLANVIYAVVTGVVILIVPKFLSVDDYGYWQLYVFYTSYVVLTQLGWSDGIYLRVGGASYGSLDRSIYFSQFWMLVGSQFLVFLALCGASAFVDNHIRILVIQATGASFALMNMRFMLSALLQATNRLREYSVGMIADRLLYLVLVAAILLAGRQSVAMLVLADLVAKLTSLLYIAYTCRDIVLRSPREFSPVFAEVAENIRVGIRLVLAGAASLLSIGVIRFGIERTWDIGTFGQVSLTLTVANAMLVLLNAVALVLFPALRRAEPTRLGQYYSLVRSPLTVLLLAVFLVYYPVQLLGGIWLPSYSVSLKYLSLVMPMMLYEGRMSLLAGTFFKTLRRERDLLTLNALSLVLAGVLALVSTVVIRSLPLAVSSVLVVLTVRSVCAELVLSRQLHVGVSLDIALELVLATLFVASTWLLSPLLSMAAYLVGLIVYLFLRRQRIEDSFLGLRELMARG